MKLDLWSVKLAWLEDVYASELGLGSTVDTSKGFEGKERSVLFL